jgi:phosphatidylserine decarboxylase
MTAEIFISSLLIGLVILPSLAWKWNIKIMTAIFGAIIFGALSGLITYWIATSVVDLHIALLILIEFCLILTFTAIIILLRFYRDPEREPPEMENVILSPADGKVVYISKVEKGSSLVVTKRKQKFELNEITSTDLLTDITYLVGIDMTILNVHVNRAPVGGNVLLCHRTKGKFISLRRPESDVMNERVTTVIDNEQFRLGIIQISSRLVRKIIMRIKEDEVLTIGQRIGSSVFGSQVNVAIPELENIKIEVKVNDEVKAGITVIARYDGV